MLITDTLMEFGNGDPVKGEYLLKNIAKVIKTARQKHTRQEWLAMDINDAKRALEMELIEVSHAISHEPEKRVAEELRDVITVAVRMLNKEYGKE